MKLATVHITDFKSVKDSGTFNIGDVTCLVGRNESGKTALLQALYRLNPLVESQGNFDVTEDYPRAEEEDYQQAVERKEHGPARVVDARFTLESAEVTSIEEEFGPNALSSPTLALTKGYDNDLDGWVWLNEPEVGAHLVAKAGLTEALAKEKVTWTTLKELKAALDARAARQGKEFSEAQTRANAITDADEKAKAIAALPLLQESSAAKTLRDHLSGYSRRVFTNTSSRNT